MKKRMTIMLVSVAVVFGALFGFQQFKAYMMAQYFASQGLPPATVTAMQAAYSDWQPAIRAVGTLRARQGVDLVGEVAGTITAVHFKPGDSVKAGAMLVELDSEAEQAQLEAAMAAADLAGTNYERDKAQFKVKAVSQAQLDADKADLRAKKAKVKQLRALLDKMRIRAPFSGKLGVSTISVGQYVKPGTVLVSLQDLQPMRIDFNVPQKMLPRVKPGQSATVSVNAFAGRSFEARVRAIDSRVDKATRNVRIEADVDNADDLLLPGMFAEVRLESGAAERHLTLPQTAITYNAYGATLFLARPGKPAEAKEDKDEKDPAKKPMPVAEQIFVKTGPTRGDQVAILEGVKEGDMVVTSGQMKLKNGTPLIINNSHPPAFETAPTPQEH